jgi:hypothetical protein
MMVMSRPKPADLVVLALEALSEDFPMYVNDLIKSRDLNISEYHPISPRRRSKTDWNLTEVLAFINEFGDDWRLTENRHDRIEPFCMQLSFRPTFLTLDSLII